MDPIGNCLKEAFKILSFLSLYLILEVGALAAILVTSVILTHCIIRSGVYVYSLDRDKGDIIDIELCDLARSMMVCWFIGAFTLKWSRSWQSQITPIKLQEFQENGYPRLCAGLRNFIVPVLLIVCTCCQICTYFFKFYQKTDFKRGQDVEMNQLLYRKYLIFLGSLWLLVYLSVRIFRFYRDVEKARIEKGMRMKIHRPTWATYFESYYSLLTYELFLIDVILLSLLGIGAIFEDDNKVYHWFPYIFACMIASGIGIVLADVEEHMPWLDNRMDQSQPYFRLIHWDVRLHLLTFFLLPLLSVGYFRSPDDFKDNQKDNLLHNLLHLAFIANFWACINKGQALFSYVIRGHYWNGRRRRSARDRNQPPQEGNGTNGRENSGNNRIFPQLNGASEIVPGNDACGGGNVNVNHPSGGQIGFTVQNEDPASRRGMLSIMKNLYLDYFPLNVSSNDAGTDQGSVSTGTCTSLLNRQNVDNGSVQVVVIEAPESLQVAVSQLEPPDEEYGNGEMEEINLNSDSEEILKENLVPDSNNNPTLMMTIEMATTKKNEIAFSVEAEEESIRLNRVPSKVLD